MGKLTPKQIREQTRNEVARYYSKELACLKKTRDELEQQLRDKTIVVETLKAVNLDLKEEIEKLRDWNTRLQEFCNMTDEDREEAVKAFRAKAAADAAQAQAKVELERELASHPFLQFLRHFTF